jgi:RNAse (barnase) inhibitor barstar
MPVYHSDPGDGASETLRRAPYRSFALSILHNGPVALYRSSAILEQDLEELEGEGFVTVRLGAQRWARDASVLHDDLTTNLQLPDYYGGTLDALRDCLRSTDWLEIPDDGGVVVVIENAEAVRADWLSPVVDVFADASRLLQVFGRTLLVFVQGNDPELGLGRLGGLPAAWNRREFLRSAREAGG